MATLPLVISTPDGSGQPVHPDIVDSASGFAGHRFWLACTPYPYGADHLENPVIRVSDDGTHWSVPRGVPDPVVEAPKDLRYHWSDTDLVLSDGRLFLFFRGCMRGRDEAQLHLTTSNDGASWTTPEVIYTGQWALSPAVVHEPGGWSMWHIWCDGSTSRLLRQKADAPVAWQSPEVCRLIIPGHVPWHIDVVSVASGYEALICAFPTGTDPSRCRLFHASSADGLAFSISGPTPLMKPNRLGWPNRMIYRSTFLKQDDGTYRIWFSAASWGMRCGVGLVEGPLDKLVPVTAGTYRPALLASVREDLKGIATYIAVHRTPPWLRGLLRRLVRRG